jgi:hypothetical protein
MSDIPPYGPTMDAIISFYGITDHKGVNFWADVYDGRAWRAFPEFWNRISRRAPDGQVTDVLARWDLEELRTLWHGLVWSGGERLT